MKRALKKAFGVVILPLFLTVSAHAQGLPDLTVTSLLNPSRAGTGQPVVLTNVIANIGSPTSNATWRYRIYISTNSTVTTNDTVLATSQTFFDIASQTSITNTDTVLIPANNPTGTCYFGVVVDYDNNVIESNEANNARSSAPFTVYYGPDLTVLSVIGPTAAGTGQMLTLTNILANVGVGAAGNWRYRIYLSTNSTITTNSAILTTQGVYNDFPPQTSMTNFDTVTVPPSTAPGVYFFGVIIDFDNIVAESNELNNVRASGAVNISIGPDLAVPSVTGPSTAGTAQTLTLTNILANIGTGTAGSWRYRIYLSTNSLITTNATVLTTQGAYVDFPAQTAMTNYDTVMIPAGTTPGTYYFGVIIDFDNSVLESNEGNNTGASAPVSIGTGPDLTVTSLGSPSAAGTAQTLILTNVMANIGVGTAGNWKYRIYLSTNATTAATNGIVLTTQGAFVDFAAQTTITNFDAVSIPSALATGVYYFAVMIDFDNLVTEANETNNIRVAGPVNIGIGPDLSVLSVTAPAHAGPGLALSMTEILANMGIGVAGSWSYRIYLSTNAAVTTNDTVLTTQGVFTDFPAQTTLTNSDIVVIPPGTPPGVYYLGVIIDFNNVVPESNEGNNLMISQSMPVGPTILAIAVQTSTISVNVAGLAVPDGYSLQYTSTLTDSNSWATGTVFTAQDTSTNVTDIVTPSVTARYYRIRHQ